MRSMISRRLFFLSIVEALILLSCSSYYWTDPDSADLEKGDLVYKVKTFSGDTINFRSRPRSSGVFNGEEICGIDENGDELTLGLAEVRDIELADWNSGRKYFAYGCIAACMVYLYNIMSTRLGTP